jgi:hypothetical protein
MTRLGSYREKRTRDRMQIAGRIARCPPAWLLHRDIKLGNILFNEGGVPNLWTLSCPRSARAAGGQSGRWSVGRRISRPKTACVARGFPQRHVYARATLLTRWRAVRRPRGNLQRVAAEHKRYRLLLRTHARRSGDYGPNDHSGGLRTLVNATNRTTLIHDLHGRAAPAVRQADHHRDGERIIGALVARGLALERGRQYVRPVSRLYSLRRARARHDQPRMSRLGESQCRR